MEFAENNFQDDEHDEKNSVWDIVLKYGKIGIPILIFIRLIQTALWGSSFDGLYSNVFGVVLILIQDVVYVVIMILATQTYLKKNSESTSFWSIFKMSYLTGLFLAFISMFSYILIFYFFASAKSLIAAMSLSYLTSFLKNSLIGLVVAGVISFIMKRYKTVDIPST